MFTEEDFLPSAVTDQQLQPTTQHPNEENNQNCIRNGNADKDNEDDEDLRLEHEKTPTKETSPMQEKLSSKKLVSPVDLRPFPKRKSPQQRKSKKQKSEVITSSLFKDRLLQAEQIKKEAEIEREKKKLAKEGKR